MEKKLFYLELSAEPIRFDAVSQLTNVFFDDSNRQVRNANVFSMLNTLEDDSNTKNDFNNISVTFCPIPLQVFAVRSGGATGCCVKGPGDADVISFCMENKGPIRSIKFSPNNKILAIQRTDTSVDFVNFVNNQPQMNDMVVYKGKNVTVHGFVWVHEKEVAVISNGSVEMVVLNMEKKQAKCLKSISLTVNWFMWYPIGNLAVLATNNGSVLMPVILKQGTITKLPKLEPQNERGIPERDVTLAQIYGTFAILILRPTETRTLSVVIYLLNGPGLAPKKSHVLCLGHSGRFAINIVDDLVVVHHQATGTSMLFDIALSGETDSAGVVHHTPITPGRPIKPFALKMPSLSFDGETKKCELCKH